MAAICWKAEKIDRKLIERYGINLSKGQRFRRKQRGVANLQYIRFGDKWVMLGTRGSHEWFVEEGSNIRDCRRVPLILEGYSIRVVQGDFVLNREKKEADGPPERDTRAKQMTSAMKWMIWLGTNHPKSLLTLETKTVESHFPGEVARITASNW